MLMYQSGESGGVLQMVCQGALWFLLAQLIDGCAEQQGQVMGQQQGQTNVHPLSQHGWPPTKRKVSNGFAT